MTTPNNEFEDTNMSKETFMGEVLKKGTEFIPKEDLNEGGRTIKIRIPDNENTQFKHTNMTIINVEWVQQLLKRTIQTWGNKAQFEMAQEEATELALAIRKYIRKGDEKSFLDLAGEIADVEIMIEQMDLMETSLRMAVNHIKLEKLERLEKRLEAHSFE